MATAPDSRAWVLTKAILAAVQAQYAIDAAVDPTVALPARQFATAGVVIYDSEQLSVSLIRQFGVDGDSGTEGEYPQRCLAWRGIEVEIMLLRCAPTITVSATGELFAPSVAEQVAYGKLVTDDAARIVQALLTGLADDLFGFGPVMTLSAWNATNEADLGGGSMRVKLSLV